MALSQVGFGLKPINKVGSNYNAAQVSEYIGFNGGYNLAFQMPVKVATGTGASTQVRPQYTEGDRITGSFIGVSYEDRNTGKPVFADHVTSNDLIINRFNYETDTASYFVTDDPYQLYLMKISADMTVSAMNGNYYPNYAGGLPGVTTTADGKRSIVKLDTESSATNNSTAVFKFMHVGSSVDDKEFSSTGTYSQSNSDILNAGSNVVVMINKHRYNAGTFGGTG